MPERCGSGERRFRLVAKTRYSVPFCVGYPSFGSFVVEKVVGASGDFPVYFVFAAGSEEFSSEEEAALVMAARGIPFVAVQAEQRWRLSRCQAVVAVAAKANPDAVAPL